MDLERCIHDAIGGTLFHDVYSFSTQKFPSGRGFLNLENCPDLTICYFLKLMRILMVLKCKIILFLFKINM